MRYWKKYQQYFTIKCQQHIYIYTYTNTFVSALTNIYSYSLTACMLLVCWFQSCTHAGCTYTCTYMYGVCKTVKEFGHEFTILWSLLPVKEFGHEFTILWSLLPVKEFGHEFTIRWSLLPVKEFGHKFTILWSLLSVFCCLFLR